MRTYVITRVGKANHVRTYVDGKQIDHMISNDPKFNVEKMVAEQIAFDARYGDQWSSVSS